MLTVHYSKKGSLDTFTNVTIKWMKSNVCETGKAYDIENRPNTARAVGPQFNCCHRTMPFFVLPEQNLASAL